MFFKICGSRGNPLESGHRGPEKSSRRTSHQDAGGKQDRQIIEYRRTFQKSCGHTKLTSIVENRASHTDRKIPPTPPEKPPGCQHGQQ